MAAGAALWSGGAILNHGGATGIPAASSADSSSIGTVTTGESKDSSASTSSSSGSKPDEFYEVEIEKPYGIKFYKGTDGGTYIDALAPGGSAAKTKMFQPGDKVLATSAVFGNEIWPAAEYGRTMYTVRQRIGPLLMKMQKKYGEREDQAVSSEKLAAQRNANVISEQLREIQIQNYKRKMQLKKQREEDLRDGLQLYKKSAYQEALSKFESVLGSKPEGLEEAIASYNVACCYAKLDQVEAGLSALGEALEAGFEDYKKIRTDEDLASLRASPEFKALIDKYDEPIFNENAVKAIKGLFGFFGKT
ncbi:hypothetical protein SELMODRAFT_448423 [Selaginella moellendorffii]|uniref:PDZ domain-containing protein n=1 Tax=Selaginella moellendorffii TaxID=88036 RepID=D8T770_SELML|nr:hypothetical protein SELMODRAFT_448423 [Selaginella moellendorffii]